MYPYSALVLGLVATAVAVTGAAGTWQSKPFNMWTDGELKEVVTNSPWAGKATMTWARRPAGDPEQGPSITPLEGVALVSWSSALPLRQATERGKFKAGTAVPPDVQARLASESDAYVITVVNTYSSDFFSQVALMHQVTVTTPSDFAAQAAPMYPETSLRRAGEPPLRPSRIDKLGVDDGVAAQNRRRKTGVFWQREWPRTPHTASLYVFTFPKADLNVEDAKVEFATKICSTSLPNVDKIPPPQCNVNIKKTFTLKDMIYNSALAL